MLETEGIQDGFVIKKENLIKFFWEYGVKVASLTVNHEALGSNSHYSRLFPCGVIDNIFGFEPKASGLNPD